jgi:hypothetical protein
LGKSNTLKNGFFSKKSQGPIFLAASSYQILQKKDNASSAIFFQKTIWADDRLSTSLRNKNIKPSLVLRVRLDDPRT